MSPALQILRLYAALLVLGQHIEDRLAGFSENYHVAVLHIGFDGSFGVRIFFVISGLLMVWIAHDRFGSLRNVGRFFIDRVTRIAPLYWSATTVQALFLAWAASRKDPAALANLSLENFLRSLFFIPYLNESGKHRPLLEQGWTLNYEMFFYILFGLSLAFPRALGFSLSLGLLLGLYLWGIGTPIPIEWLSLLSSDMLLDFGAGMLLGHITAPSKCPLDQRRTLPFQNSLILLLVGTCSMVLDSGFGGGWCLSSTAAVTAVALCAFFQNAGESRLQALLVQLGNASYSLYLTHGFALLAVGIFWRKVFGGDALWLYFAICTMSAVSLSWLCWKYFEVPITRVARWALTAGSPE